ncbi:hypothetical protein D9M72_627800 [compost metagenome]
MRSKFCWMARSSSVPSIAAACSAKVRKGSSVGAARLPLMQQAWMRASAAAVRAAHRPPTLLPQMPGAPSEVSFAMNVMNWL